MKLPTQKRILREDVKEAPEWINKIIGPFNNLAETIYQALNRNITVTENLAAFVKELTVTTTASYPTMDPVELTNTLRTKAIGVLCLQAVERLTYEAAPGPMSISWVENNGTIILSKIGGLAASKSYSVRLLVM